jgi:two-component system OmpR family sensor kinase/two-component system sensor histidine kinase BaeS
MSSEPSNRRAGRFLPFAISLIIFALFFVGGVAAILYLLFSRYSGIQNIWFLVCGAPVILVVLIIVIVVSLYLRYGKPLEGIFIAINAVEAGDLSARAPENNSDMFSDLIKRFNKMIGELERAEQQRRNLTADIAHELRTPLHIIQGNLEGMLDGVYQPTSEHLHATLDEIRLLTRLVDDLQTLSLAEMGQLQLNHTHFLLADLIQDLLLSFSSPAATLGIDLKAKVSQQDYYLTADYDRLDQAFSNLLSNALRHTSAGGTVTIEVSAIHSSARNVLILVKDSGEGIAPEDLPFIFDRFWRKDKSRSERANSGLGLAITKQLIHAHGGNIKVESIVGSGSTFVVELPCHLQTK